MTDPVTTLVEPDGHGRQGDPGRAGAKSLPEARPETPSGSTSAERPGQLTIDAFPEWTGELPVPFGIIPF